MKAIDLATTRRLVLRYLAEVSRKSPETPIEMCHLEDQIGHWWSEEQGNLTRPSNGDWTARLNPDGVPKVHEIIWELVVGRVLALSRFKSQGLLQDQNWRYLRLTGYGAKVVLEQLWSPYDPGGYLKELAARAPTLTQLCGMYVAEALTCFQGGAYLATVVMLGAASEGIVFELFRRFSAALKVGGVAEAGSVESKIEKEPSIYRKYQIFRKHFDVLVRPKLPGELRDDLNLQFDGVFNLIRYYRNDAGHPTGARIERMSAYTSLMLFIPYCKRVEELANWLGANSDKLI